LFSEFVSTKIMHDLYQLCCNKRFSANVVEKMTPPSRTTINKYLVMQKPKEDQPPPPIETPKTPTIETRRSTNPWADPSTHLSPDYHPPEVKRRTSHNSSHIDHGQRPRAGTEPFIEHPEQLQHISTMRSGNGAAPERRVQYYPKHDEREEEQQ
jgi:hypothetical protein